MEHSSMRTPVERALAGRDRFPSVLAPVQVGAVQLANRLFFAAMGIDLAGLDGCMSPALAGFYDGIADGGCGFLILSNATVSRDSILQPRGLRMFEPAHAEALAPFIARQRAKGVVVGVQLQHYGGQGVTKYTRGKPMLTPSGIPSPALMKLDPRYRVRAMDGDDIALVIRQFADAAALSASAGAQLIQLQASNGYLLSSFLSPHTNRREDGYGGGPLERSRLLVEVVAAIRARVGPAVSIGVRLGVDDFLGPAGSLPADFKDVIPMLEDAGMDLIEVSMGTAETFYKLSGRTREMEESVLASVARIRRYSRVPVGFAGLVDGLEMAERIVADGTADLVGMARALFADNDLIVKTVEQGSASVTRCLWDGKCFKDKYNPRYDRVYCCVNPKYLRPE